ncbi:MAG: hypothetical protein HOP30_11080 [Cyclobacteriaceae bacterium]|nr:hypothetical protein [Cyclobacteriaceae bacterium]
MKSFFSQLYIDLSDHLKKEIPDLKWIDQDFGQLEVFEYRAPVTFPCVLIDFTAAQYDNMSLRAQKAIVSVTLRLGFAPFSQTYQAAPLDVKEKALEYYDVEQAVYKALQGWQASGPEGYYCEPFMRISSQTEQRVSASGTQDASGLRVRIITFNTGYDDLSAVPVARKVTASLEITPEIND